MTATFVETVIEAWLELELDLSSVLIASDVMRLPDNSKAAISIETRDSLAMVEIWEHPASLDTTLLSKTTTQGTIMAAGSCEGRTEIEQRLKALQTALLHGHESV